MVAGPTSPDRRTGLREVCPPRVHDVDDDTGINLGNPAFLDEFFGPVVSFLRVKTEDEAVTLANDSDFGMAESVWTQDEARGERVASAWRA